MLDSISGKLTYSRQIFQCPDMAAWLIFESGVNGACHAWISRAQIVCHRSHGQKVNNFDSSKLTKAEHATVKIEKSLFLLDTKSDNKFFFVNVFKKVFKVYSNNQILIKQINKFEI